MIGEMEGWKTPWIGMREGEKGQCEWVCVRNSLESVLQNRNPESDRLCTPGAEHRNLTVMFRDSVQIDGICRRGRQIGG